MTSQASDVICKKSDTRDDRGEKRLGSRRADIIAHDVIGTHLGKTTKSTKGAIAFGIAKLAKALGQYKTKLGGSPGCGSATDRLSLGLGARWGVKRL